MPPDLNLHPLVDCMGALSLLLMAMAGWSQVASLDVESPGSGGCGIGEVGGPNPLTVHISAGGAWIGRRDGRVVPRREGGIDAAALDAAIREDRERFPGERLVIVNTDDGVAFGDTATALDLARASGYDAPLLAGGPAMR